MLLIGPAGVFVIDVKRWRANPEIRDGRLHCGDSDRDREIDKIVAVTRIAEDVLTSADLLGTAVMPLMVFAGYRVDTACRQVRLTGSENLMAYLVGLPPRLQAAQVRRITARLEQAFPAYDNVAVDTSRPPAAVADALFDESEVIDAALAAARAEPIESWMTFLHHDQIKLVRRDFGGPARISGAAGTGKTVVALHRAVYLATRTVGPVLFVTYANNLPRVQARLMNRMAPAVADRIQFTSLHGWATAFLAARGITTTVKDRFANVWLAFPGRAVLERLDPNAVYWKEEIDHVIKGRGITTIAEYTSLPRIGRRTPLPPAARQAVWDLYEAYEQAQRAHGVIDFNDLLTLARDEVAREPAHPPYAAVIVDEVQDLNVLGIRLLHALIGEAPNGLLLIGDCRQAVSAGGFRLADAGITIRGGRAEVLRVNYRNGADILAAASAILAEDTFDDIDGTTVTGRPDVDLDYRDGIVQTVATASDAELDAALLTALTAVTDDGTGFGDAAILCASRADIDHYRGLLQRNRIPVEALEQYNGTPRNAVKIGTFRRAKGLEFKYVFLPHHATPKAANDTGHHGDHDRRALATRQLFVAMTRARDLLWLGVRRGDATVPDS
jgi:superfamily I DNA/RNA helicase